MARAVNRTAVGSLQRRDSAAEASARDALDEVKRRVALLRDHLKAEIHAKDDEPYCIPCTNRASPRMQRHKQTCEGTSRDRLAATYCPGDDETFDATIRLNKHQQHGIMRAWNKQYRSDGEGYCKTSCLEAGRPYDDTNCCPVTVPGGRTGADADMEHDPQSRRRIQRRDI